MKELKKPRSFTVDGKRWCRGGKGGYSALLNTQGNMCCLGFYARACGVQAGDICGVPDPCSLTYSGIVLPSTCHKDSSEHLRTVENMMQINDDTDIWNVADDFVRARKIKSLFKRIGVTVRFINVGKPPRVKRKVSQ